MIHRRPAPLLLLTTLACLAPRASARPVRPTAGDCAEYAQRAALIANQARASGKPTAAARLAALGEAQTALKCIKHRRLVPGSFWMSVGVSGGYHAIAVQGRPSDVGSFADTLLLSVIPAFHWDFSGAFGLMIGICFGGVSRLVLPVIAFVAGVAARTGNPSWS